MSQYQPPGRSINPIHSLTRRGKVGVLLALIFFVIGLPVVWIKGTVNYSSQAIFEVSPRYQKIQTDDKEQELQSNSQYREFVNHLAQSIRRYDLIEAAVNRLVEENVKVCLPSETIRKCIERLQRVLVILPVPDTYMMRIILNDSDKSHLDVIVNAILDQFVRLVKDEQIFGWDQRVQALSAQQVKIQSEVTDLEKRRSELALSLGLTSFHEAVTNPYDVLLAKMKERLVEVEIDRSYAESSLNAYQLQKESSTREAKSAMDIKTLDTSLQTLRNEIIKQIEDQSRTMSGLQPSHPTYIAAKKERDALQKRLNEREAQADLQAHQNVLARLKAAYQQTVQVEQELQKKVEATAHQANNFANHFREAMVISNDLTKRAKELNDIRDRINFLTLESGALGWVKVVQRAMPAITPTGVGRTRMILALMLLCLVIAIASPMAMDFLDRRILTVGDAEKVMNMQAAGWMILVENEATRLLGLEQCRRLASMLLRNSARSENHIFAFSPVSFGGEATDVILRTAKTLQSLGTRVLVVDANPLRMNSPFDNNQSGLTDMLANGVEPLSVISSFEFENVNLSVVPIGVHGMGLQRLDRLKAAISKWSEQYDMILVDSPPLMHSADSELLIDIIGNVFVVVEVGEVTRSDLMQARNLVKKLDPTAVGLIVNKLPMDTAGTRVRRHVAETITLTPFNQLMSISMFKLYWNVLLLKKQNILSKWRKSISSTKS